MAFHYPAASSGGHGHGPQSTPTRMSFNAAHPRTSSKRSFDEYGHSDVGSSSQPSGSSAQITQTTSSMAMTMPMPMAQDPMAIMPVDTQPDFGDLMNNTHNTRFKRRRNSLVASPSDSENAVRKCFPRHATRVLGLIMFLFGPMSWLATPCFCI